MKKIYIKFEEGNQESLDRACREAERLGYKKSNIDWAIYFEGNGILDCESWGTYLTTQVPEHRLIELGYKEHLITNTMKYKQGDILVDRGGKARKILGVCGELYFLSCYNDFGISGEYYTIQELDRYGYKLKTEPKTSIREVTMQEIEEKFGEPVVIRE